MWKSIVAICIGASLGALLRWWLGARLNSHFPTIPPGTLAANLIGGYVIGMAVAFFASFPALPPEWRLFIITGFWHHDLDEELGERAQPAQSEARWTGHY